MTSTMPTGLKFKGVPMPFFFHESSAVAFRELETRADDVVLSSLPKGGTTWTNKIINLLLHGIDNDGKAVPNEGINSSGQVYPDAIPLKRVTADPDPSDFRRNFFGDWGFEDLVNQPSPRLFSTHFAGEDLLPAQLLAPGANGRLVVVLRNLKDVLSSLHFFRGEAKDGWLGNEHGPGSLARFIAPDSPNAYGSPFAWVKKMDQVVGRLQAEGRVCVVYFEQLKQNLPQQVGKLASFLGLECSPAKLEAVCAAAGFDAMKATLGSASVLLRKGGVGDWKNHLDPGSWSQFDKAFEAALDGVQLAEPMKHFQYLEIPGLPPPQAEQTIPDCDPRSWPRFERVTLQDGLLVRDKLIATKGPKVFVRPPSEFNHIVEPPGTEGARFVAEPDRYHLFVSGVCPWASGCVAVREVLGLQDVISMDVADGQSGAGWVYLNGVTCPPWDPESGQPVYLQEVYQLDDPLGTSRITVPILWDKKTQCIVSNDSWSILKMLARAFAPLGSTGLQLFPQAMEQEIEAKQAELWAQLLNGVYRSGIARIKGNLEATAAAAEDVYAMLDHLDSELDNQQFVLGAELTLVDVRLLMMLLRYDTAYRVAFGLSGGRGGVLDGESYPRITQYIRRLYPLIKPTVRWVSFGQYYRWAALDGEIMPDFAPLIASADTPAL